MVDAGIPQTEGEIKMRHIKKKIAFKITYPTGILLEATVAKRDIEAYASQKIDLDTSKKRVAITEM